MALARIYGGIQYSMFFEDGFVGLCRVCWMFWSFSYVLVAIASSIVCAQ